MNPAMLLAAAMMVQGDCGVRSKAVVVNNRALVQSTFAVPVGYPVANYATASYPVQSAASQVMSGYQTSVASQPAGPQEIHHYHHIVEPQVQAMQVREEKIKALLLQLSELLGTELPGAPLQSSTMDLEKTDPPGLTILQNHCQGCHAPGGKGADASTFFDGHGTLISDGTDDIGQRIVNAISSGKMPKGQDPLPDAAKTAVLGYLTGDTQ